MARPATRARPALDMPCKLTRQSNYVCNELRYTSRYRRRDPWDSRFENHNNDVARRILGPRWIGRDDCFLRLLCLWSLASRSPFVTIEHDVLAPSRLAGSQNAPPCAPLSSAPKPPPAVEREPLALKPQFDSFFSEASVVIV